MTRTTEMNEIIEERYQLCISLYFIQKETDKRNKEKRKRGEKNLVYVDIFALPSHIKILFGPFLKTPRYTKIATLMGHTYGVIVSLFTKTNCILGVGILIALFAFGIQKLTKK